MPNDKPSAETNRVLVKLRPSNALRAAESRVNLEPLHDTPLGTAGAFGLDSAPQWFIAELPDGAATPWDLAHARVADQLGVAESDVIFAEPDLVHRIFKVPDPGPAGQAFAVGDDCTADPQDAGNGKAIGPKVFGWHLDDDFSQLGSARDAVPFTDLPLQRTRIAHIDTGYYGAHETVPAHVRHDLEKSFVDGDANPSSAQSPGNHPLILDNSDHGTGTLSILAGGTVSAFGAVLGGAPEAEILPLRVADSVVLLRTSALARALVYATQQGCDVVTLSMGGLPSDAWAEAVDQAYEAGLCICAAAGNHTGALPPRVLVYPARYNRVIAVCGVMANGKPYADLTGKVLEGSFGPDSVMKAAIAAYTPNIPWARFGCKNVVRLNGEGTSSATPQVAAAVALWFEKYKTELPRNFQRIEAVRRALFSTAKQKDDRAHFGNGVLQARAALDVKPVLGLPKSAPSDNSFAFLRVVTGLGIAEPPPRERMFNLELAQRWLVNDRLQEIVPDPDAVTRLDGEQLRQFMEAVIEDQGASLALRRQVASRYPVAAGGSAPHNEQSQAVIPDPKTLACDAQPVVRNPPYRRIRVYAVDPSLSTRLSTAGINEVTLKIRWEKLEKGPAGEYLRVDDVDAAKKRYEPVNLDDPRLLAQDGWAPSEGNPQFHQQMAYAVAMKTIEHFEIALGRPVLWRPGANPKNEFDDSLFVKQLAVHPHALQQANAFYSPQEIALQFGYFEAAADDPGDHMPGSRVYACLSHDIVAHETTHAILDGMHRRFNEPTNVDVLALHEGFADIVALMQHFTIPEVLEHEISRTRGDIEAESMLGSLAVQFGYATGGRGALRDAIGHFENGVWKRFVPDPADLQKRQTPHSRGAILVGAVFDAFIAIYKERIADLLRIYTGGTGVLPSGAIHPDLVRRLADEATKSASHVLNMCIRALDYLPPVDVTFFEYLRALITADFDLVTDDRHNYRVAFVEAFRRRGIYPLNLEAPSQDTLRTLSVDTLRWQGLDRSKFTKKVWTAIQEQYLGILEGLKQYANACFYLEDREKLFHATRDQRRTLHEQLKVAFKAVPEFAAELGIDPRKQFEVHELRRSMRVGPDGRYIPQLIVALTQLIEVPANKQDGTPAHVFRGGSTLVVDLSVPEVKYRIIKNIKSTNRQKRTADFVNKAAADPLRALFFAPDRPEPFAALHALADDGF
ncbi:MAG TPA: S8 family serine peptidase [Thermoanaerobaculia bacterium]|nr:S8 family serine peptidase [Thermoanaerobaculia bacterium]